MVLGVGAFFILFVGLDEPLDSATTACLQQAPPPRAEDNLFFAVLGLNARKGVGAVQAGRAAASAYQSALREHVRDGSPFQFDFPGARIESETEIRSLCDPLNGPCPASFLDESATVRALLERNASLVSNYRGLPRFQSFVVTLTPHVEAPVVPAGHLVMAQRLLHAQAVLQLAGGRVSEAAEALVDDLAVSRLLLAESDHLVYKMVAAALMARSFKLLSQIADVVRPLPDEISGLDGLLRPLMVKELSLASSLCGEFRLLASVFLYPDAVVEIAKADVMSMGFLTRLAYKPYATSNLAFRDLHTTLEELDALPHPQFLARYPGFLERRTQQEQTNTLDYLLSWPWNPVGRILISVSRPAYARWYARLYDLEGLRRLVVLKLLVRKHALGDEQLQQLIADRIDGLGDPYLDQPLRFDAIRRILGFHTLSQREAPPHEAGRWEVTLPRLAAPGSPAAP